MGVVVYILICLVRYVSGLFWSLFQSSTCMFMCVVVSWLSVHWSFLLCFLRSFVFSVFVVSLCLCLVNCFMWYLCSCVFVVVLALNLAFYMLVCSIRCSCRCFLSLANHLFVSLSFSQPSSVPPVLPSFRYLCIGYLWCCCGFSHNTVPSFYWSFFISSFPPVLLDRSSWFIPSCVGCLSFFRSF